MSAKILIIDDSEQLRSIFKLTLEFKGYSVTTANDGREGLAAAKAQAFDLIFCDIEMPVMNGLEFVRAWRKQGGDTPPIIMLTAEGNDVISMALAAGADGAISKPFEPIHLLNEIERRLSRSS